jgi:diguanylate cyclase (GGDEF)-like protein
LGRGDWLSWKKEDGLLNNTVWAIHQDNAGQTWIGSDGGVNVIDSHGKVTRSWSTHDGLVAGEVHSLAEGPNSEIYAATYPNGISRFSSSGKLLDNYRSASVMSAGWIQTIAFDHQGRLWAGGADGCFRSRRPLGAGNLELDRVEIPGMAKGTQFFEFIADGDTLWAGSSHGLAHLVNGQWRIFKQKDGLKSDAVFVLARGGDALWISYEDALGLSKLEFNGSQIKRTDFTRKNGLASDEVFGIVFDTAGRLWASSDAGIDLFERGHWRHFGREDGLIWIDSDSLALEADRKGNVWIGTSAGLSRYSPPRLRNADAPPPIVLTSIEGGSRQWNPSDHPILPFNQRSLFMQFAALNYAEEDHIRFRYRLLGYETRWHETSERGVHFERLPAGHYLFQVIASGPNDVWTPQPVEFAFSVTPPWWQTWRFLLTSLGLFLLLLWALYRLRVRVLVEHKHRLERLVAERTAELTDSHRRLEEIAYCDMLTLLPNRREFTRQLSGRIESAHLQNERFALLLIDLDHFKDINDTYGHGAGDVVLVETAKRLRASVREYDCVARLGGDEFAIILISTFDKDSIQETCNRIISHSSDAIPFNGKTLQIGISVGVALYPNDGQNEESLYKASDMALYVAKRRRSSYSFVSHATA